ncbi:hypothetical protein Lalb_Chr23g0275271 [Lupinus albus]|uniref:Uncharacterized protein n=1 Tax=Lupinus albus TaxID=3870 RepID=A0A6A4NFL9_LUPAL|nr:hypothetical protein Lalb_Chr23g0275271 [Lupinus albus]
MKKYYVPNQQNLILGMKNKALKHRLKSLVLEISSTCHLHVHEVDLRLCLKLKKLVICMPHNSWKDHENDKTVKF